MISFKKKLFIKIDKIFNLLNNNLLYNSLNNKFK